MNDRTVDAMAECCGALKRIAGRVAAARELIGQLPSGLDIDARPDDLSPVDAVAHVGGLVAQQLDAVLADLMIAADALAMAAIRAATEGR